MCRSQAEFITIAEAAGYLETTETRILMMLKKNELSGMQDDDGWKIDKASLQLCGKPQPSDIAKKGCGGGCGNGGCGGH